MKMGAYYGADEGFVVYSLCQPRAPGCCGIPTLAEDDDQKLCRTHGQRHYRISATALCSFPQKPARTSAARLLLGRFLLRGHRSNRLQIVISRFLWNKRVLKLSDKAARNATNSFCRYEPECGLTIVYVYA